MFFLQNILKKPFIPNIDYECVFIMIDRNWRMLLLSGQGIKNSVSDILILRCLLEMPGQVVMASREVLDPQVWKRAFRAGNINLESPAWRWYLKLFKSFKFKSQWCLQGRECCWKRGNHTSRALTPKSHINQCGHIPQHNSFVPPPIPLNKYLLSLLYKRCYPKE